VKPIVNVRKHLSNVYPIQNCWKQGDVLKLRLRIGPRKSGKTGIETDNSAFGLCRLLWFIGWGNTEMEKLHHSLL